MLGNVTRLLSWYRSRSEMRLILESRAQRKQYTNLYLLVIYLPTHLTRSDKRLSTLFNLGTDRG